MKVFTSPIHNIISEKAGSLFKRRRKSSLRRQLFRNPGKIFFFTVVCVFMKARLLLAIIQSDTGTGLKIPIS